MYFLEESFLPNFFIRRFSSVLFLALPFCPAAPFPRFGSSPRPAFVSRLRFISLLPFRPAAPFPRFDSSPRPAFVSRLRFISLLPFCPAVPFSRFGSFPRSRPAFIFRLRLIPVPPPHSRPAALLPPAPYFPSILFRCHFSRRSSSDVTNPQCKSFS